MEEKSWIENFWSPESFATNAETKLLVSKDDQEALRIFEFKIHLRHDYVAAIQKYLILGHERQVDASELHPQKPEKIHIVFNSSAETG